MSVKPDLRGQHADLGKQLVALAGHPVIHGIAIPAVILVFIFRLGIIGNFKGHALDHADLLRLFGTGNAYKHEYLRKK